MAQTIVGTSGASLDSATTISAAVPAGSGRLLAVVVIPRANTITASPGGSWFQLWNAQSADDSIPQRPRVELYTLASGGSGTVEWTQSTAGPIALSIVRLDDSVPTTLVDDEATGLTNTGASSYDFGSVANNVTRGVCVVAAGCYDATGGVPSTINGRYSLVGVESTSGPNRLSAFFLSYPLRSLAPLQPYTVTFTDPATGQLANQTMVSRRQSFGSTILPATEGGGGCFGPIVGGKIYGLFDSAGAIAPPPPAQPAGSFSPTDFSEDFDR